MVVGWAHAGATAVAAFLASLVECIEALTVVLAIGHVRGWRPALVGALAAALGLAGIVAMLGPAIARVPIQTLQLPVGLLLLLFGLRWLRKAILRAAGVLPLHDEAAAYATAEARMLKGSDARRAGLDRVAFGTAFNIVVLEGLEVVFIVIAVAAGGPGLVGPASLGALMALAVVASLGIVLHRPLVAIPENTLKFGVGVMLSAFGTFWLGEGMDVAWPGADWSLPALAAGFLAVALAAVRLCSRVPGTRLAHPAT